MRNLTMMLVLALMWSLPAAGRTFRNPLNPSADPWLGYADGEYHLATHLATTQGDCVRLWSARSITGLKDTKPVMIWGQGKGVWAAEFHQLQGRKGLRWYCYFTRADGADIRHRMYVAESKTAGIKGPYAEPTLLKTDQKDEFYAIDGHVFEQRGKLFFLWAGHPGHRLFMSRMSDPMKVASWTQMNEPLLARANQNQVFGPGHRVA